MSTVKAAFESGFISTLQAGPSCDMVWNIPAYSLKCPLWVLQELHCVLLLFSSHLCRSLLAPQPYRQSTAARWRKHWKKTKTHCPEGAQLEDKAGWMGGQPVRSSPLILCTRPATPLLPGTPLNASVGCSSFPCSLRLLWFSGGAVTDQSWGWRATHLPTKSRSHF